MFLFYSSSLSGLTVSLSLSLIVSLSQPSNHTHHQPLATTIPTTTTTIKDTLMRPTPIKSITHANETYQVNDPHWSTWRSTPVTSMIHKPRPMNPNSQTQTHELRPTNPDPQNHRSTSDHDPRPSAEHTHPQTTSMKHRERREKKEVREERER